MKQQTITLEDIAFSAKASEALENLYVIEALMILVMNFTPTTGYVGNKQIPFIKIRDYVNTTSKDIQKWIEKQKEMELKHALNRLCK